MLKNVTFPNYKPTSNEIKNISKALREDKIASILFAVIWNIMVFITVNALVESFDISNPASFIAIIVLVIFVISGIYLIFDAIKKIRINLNELSFSSGFMIKTWVESSENCSNNMKIKYYANIELENKHILNKVEIDYELWGYVLSPVVLTIRNDEIICVTLRDVHFSR